MAPLAADPFRVAARACSASIGASSGTEGGITATRAAGAPSAKSRSRVHDDVVTTRSPKSKRAEPAKERGAEATVCTVATRRSARATRPANEERGFGANTKCQMSGRSPKTSL